MKRYILYSILIILCSFFPKELKAFPLFRDRCIENKYSSSEIFKQNISSVVLISTLDSQGSGFVVKHDKNFTYILTNAHVVANQKIVNVKWSNKEEDKGEIIGNLGGYELKNDLALIKVNGKKGKPQTLIENPPEIGSDAVVIGSPSGLEFSLTRGVVSQIRDNDNFIQIDAPVNPGNSGGPVYNHAGCVIGIVTFKASDNSEGLNFAIGYKLINKFLQDPIIDQNAINQALNSKKSLAINTELWNGIYVGMNKSQVKKTLGGDVECVEGYGFSPRIRLINCKRNFPTIPLGNKQVIPVVLFEQDLNQEIPLGGAKEVQLHLPNYSDNGCAIKSPTSSDRIEHYKYGDYIKSLLTQKYGQGTLNQYRTATVFTGNKIKIELLNWSIGCWNLRYKYDNSNL